MNVPLDTCALLCLADGTLPKKARRSLAGAREVIVPAIVVREIAIKVKTGKLQIPDAPPPWVEALARRHGLRLEHLAPAVPLLCRL